MDRRRLVLATSTAAGLLTSAAMTPRLAATQSVRSRSPEYIGAMTVMWRNVQWVLEEVARLTAAEDRDDEGWRIDVLAPFAVVDAIREAAQAIIPPVKYVTSHDLWLDALDDLEAAGLHLRNGVLADNNRSFELATQAIERARDLLDEVEALLPRRVRRLT